MKEVLLHYHPVRCIDDYLEFLLKTRYNISKSKITGFASHCCCPFFQRQKILGEKNQHGDSTELGQTKPIYYIKTTSNQYVDAFSIFSDLLRSHGNCLGPRGN